MVTWFDLIIDFQLHFGLFSPKCSLLLRKKYSFNPKLQNHSKNRYNFTNISTTCKNLHIRKFMTFNGF